LLKGKYSIYIDGVEKLESDNIITTSGINIIRKYLTGSVAEWAGSIAIGAMNSTDPSITDSILQYEFSRYPINLKSYDTSTGEIILKASFPAALAGKIYELGVFSYTRNPFSNGFDDRVIFNFDEYWLNTGVGTTASLNTSGRVGSNDLPVAANTSYAVDCTTSLDISGYSSSDYLDILYNVNTLQTSATRLVTIKFTDSQIPTPATASIALPLSASSTGYQIYSVPVSSIYKDATFNNNVTRIYLTVESNSKTSVLTIDGAKFRDVSLSDDNLCLVSRALIGIRNGDGTTDSFTKTVGSEMDIEYRMTIS
jgi:hypothetical protein